MSSVSSAVSSASLLYNIYEYEKDPLLIKEEQNQNVHTTDFHTTGTVHVVEKDDGDDGSSNKIDQKHIKKIYSIRIDKDNQSINQQVVTVVGSSLSSRLVSSTTSTTRSSLSVSSIVNSITNTIYTIYKTIQSIGIQLVLPINYPYSVRSGYIQYQIYDSIQGLCSYLRNIICSAYILEAAGVGNTSSNNSVSTSAWHAAIIWSIRDGIGLIGSLIYTYMISSYLDTYIKEFRFFADIINDLGFTFDMILPFVVSYNKNNTSNNDNESNSSTTTLFWFISSMSVLCKMMCGISAGATKSSITQHFALHGNTADLNAKESTQETIVTLLGMIGGIYIAQILHYYESQSSISSSSSSSDNDNDNENTNTSNTTNYNNRIITWIFFCILTIIHIYANYCGISLLRLRTMNRSRLDLCLHITTATTTSTNSTDNTNQSDNPNDISFLTLIDKIKSFANDNTKNNSNDMSMMITSIRPILVSIIRPPNDIHEIMYLYIWQMLGLIPKSYIYTNTISYNKLQPYFIHSSLLGQLILSEQQQSFDISSIRYNITLVPITKRTMNRNKTNNYMKYNVAISLLIGATSYDEIQAYIHAKIIVLFMMQQIQLQQIESNNNNNNNNTNDNDKQQQQHKQWLLDSYRIVQILFYNMNTASTSNSDKSISSTTSTGSNTMIPLLMSELQNKDWDVSRFYLGYPSQRYQIILNTTDTTSTTTTTRNDTISKKEN